VIQRQLLVVAILLYLALDLSSPSIPGAFMFDTTESVESAQGRVRAAAESVIPTAPVRNPSVLPRPAIHLEGRSRRAESVEREWHPLLNRQPRTLLDPAPAAEDPH
jgi:hypothetical protein